MEPIVIFIARASKNHQGSAEATHDYLLRSLEFTRGSYEKTYGILSQEPTFLTFIQTSEAFRPQGHLVTRLLEELSKARETSRSVIVVVNGWDGIFTNPFVFADLFTPYFDIRITLRFYVEVPRVFREADAQAAVQLLRCKITPDETPYDTAEFVQNIQVISLIKQDLAGATNKLLEATKSRNTPPDFHSKENEPAKYLCDECDEGFDKSLHLTMHKKPNHSNESEEDKTCHYCGNVFARKDVRIRHEEKQCRLRPGYVSPEQDPPAPRGLKRSFPSESGSTNGYTPYAQIQKYSDEWPAIDAEKPVVYRGEVFCRWSGCQRKVSAEFLLVINANPECLLSRLLSKNQASWSDISNEHITWPCLTRNPVI
jgi:hypothetical protein